MACLDDLAITNLVGNTLPADARRDALAHLDDCRTCCELVAAIAAGTPGPTAEPVRLAVGTAVGRYVVEREVGAGAMGVVYAARDPSLGRAVALKCVAATGDARAHERMLREAKAMAQLSHRHVVAIYDVGTVGDDVFLAMELLSGRTLRAWLAEAPRSPREIAAVLAGAGRGLAAAHAAGIVHRDIKPDNVLIADDGRACLTDFGLAFADEPGPADVAIDDLTATGQIVGTPVYMAPEQLDRERGAADARSDQFSFCVVLYEALVGRRPFDGRTLAELRTAIAAGPQIPPRVPAWLARVIERGLATDPARRYPAMNALLAQLARDPAIRRRRVAVLGGIALAAAAAGFAIPRSHDACPDPRPRLAGAWDDARRAQLARAFEAQPHPFTQVMLAKTSAALDGYANRWVDLRTDVCRATYDRRDQSEARYDAELACLDRRKGELAAAVDVLTAPDEDTVRHALAVAQGLPDVEPCRDGEALVGQTQLPADPAARSEAEALLARIATATSFAKVQRFQAAQAAIADVLPRARKLGFQPALASALYMQGKLQMVTRDVATAETALNEAATVAASAKDDALVAHVEMQLVYTVGRMAHRFSEAATLGKVARAAVQRAGDRADLVIEWHDVIGAALAEEGKTEDALPHFRDAVALAEHAGSLSLADQLGKLAAVLDAAGHIEEARAPSERSIALLEASLGPDHPDVAFALDALGAVEYDAGQYADAQRSYRRAVAILDKIGEPATYNTTEAIEGLGNAAQALGQLDEARAQHEKVLAIRERTAPDDPSVGDALMNLGMDLAAQGDAAGARQRYDRALAIYRKSYGPQHPQVALALSKIGGLEMGTADAVRDLKAALAIDTAALGEAHPEVAVDLGNLAGAYVDLRRYPEAVATYRRAIALHENTVGPDHPFTAMSRVGLGQALIASGDAKGAIPDLERALTAMDANHATAPQLGLARLFLARALWDGGGDRARAKQLAAQAKLDFGDAADRGSVEGRAELAQWLASH